MSIFTRCAKHMEEPEDQELTVKDDVASKDIKEKEEKHLKNTKRKNRKTNRILIASFGGNVRSVSKLTRNGVDLNVVDGQGNTALLLAVQRRHHSVAKALIDGGCDINHQNIDKNTALMLAVSNGDDRMVETLLESGADMEICNALGNYPLTYAAHHRRRKILHHLVQAGASVNVTDKSGGTALILSSRNGYSDTVELLLKAKSDIEAMDHEHNSSLISACTQGKVQNVKVLLKFGADVNHRGNNSTALVEATTKNKMEIVKDLLSHGAKINATDMRGNTALLSACRNGHIDLAKLLLDSGADPNQNNLQLHTPLWFAICSSMGSCTDLIRMILDSGVYVDFELHVAVCFGFNAIVKELLFHGTFPRLAYVKKIKLRTLSPSEFISPFTIALLSQRMDLAQFFIDYAYLVDYDLHCLSYDVKLKKFLEENGKREALKMFENLKTPFSLFTLSLRKVSRAVEFKSDRTRRVRATGLPNILQQRLLFR